MAAVLGLDDDAVRAACVDAAQGEVVSAVNLNSPGQVVIAGNAAAVERAAAGCKARGAKRVVPLPVSVPSHCGLMRPAADALEQRLATTELRTPSIPVVQNFDAQSHQDPVAIKHALVAQLYSPVRWVECVTALKARGATRIVECGPGKVLAGLVKRIDKELDGLAMFDPATLTVARTALEAR